MFFVQASLFNQTYAGQELPGDAQRGKPIFEERCASCHGLTGNGDGPQAPFLSPHPGNLISAATSIKSDQELLDIIAEGKPRTAMPPWKDLLTAQQRHDVLAYIRSLVQFNPESQTPPPPNASK
jgi:mono/diheme cytochrome c family protein